MATDFTGIGTIEAGTPPTAEQVDQIYQLTANAPDSEQTNLIQDQDKKLSSFLSTQLNTQTSMLQLTSKLTQEGVMDSESKKHLKNLDLGIQKLIASTKKK